MLEQFSFICAKIIGPLRSHRIFRAGLEWSSFWLILIYYTVWLFHKNPTRDPVKQSDAKSKQIANSGLTHAWRSLLVLYFEFSIKSWENFFASISGLNYVKFFSLTLIKKKRSKIQASVGVLSTLFRLNTQDENKTTENGTFSHPLSDYTSAPNRAGIKLWTDLVLTSVNWNTFIYQLLVSFASLLWFVISG